MTSIAARPSLYSCSLLVAGLLLGAYYHGVTDANGKLNGMSGSLRRRGQGCQRRRRTRQSADVPTSIIKSVQDGQRIIDQATADAAAARAYANGVKISTDNLTRQLAASESSGDSCTAAASGSTAVVAIVLAGVFKCADQRAGDQAAIVDQTRARGLMCEQEYDRLIR